MSQSSAIDRVVSSHTSAATDTARISVIKKEMLKKQEVSGTRTLACRVLMCWSSGGEHVDVSAERFGDSSIRAASES